MSEKLKKTMKINIGPQHPSTHGVLRLVLELDGEVIKSTEPIVGYLHRGMEKMAENMTYFQYLPTVDRIDYLSSFFCAEAFVSSVEKALKIEVPQKAQYMRVMLMELNRIASHLLWLGTFMLDLGASSPFFYCFREREVILNLFEDLTGARMMYNFHTFGGVKKDFQAHFFEKLDKFMLDFPKKVDEYEAIITKNPVFLKRAYGIGVLNKKTALAYAITGPNLRASGVTLDFRKQSPYLIYDKVEFDVPNRKFGDSWSRYFVRVQEMKESLKIVKQCADWLQQNKNEDYNLGIRPVALKVPVGMYVSNVESPRGLLSCVLVADGSEKPVRVKWRTGSFYAVQVLPNLIQNHKMSDLMTIFGSLDVILPEVDR
ncbi:MAG: NADH-quinone oxidoreductase subunit D [Candidatus Gastranaerophilales bacterium]|nr:NADH-quinone oxidoreductase subunit D [Candidatus Gastranaerophilales bacterium]